MNQLFIHPNLLSINCYIECPGLFATLKSRRLTNGGHMDEVSNLTDKLSESAKEFWRTVGDYLPQVLGALVLLVLGLVAARLAQTITERVLRLVRVDKLFENKQVARTLKSAEVSFDLISIVGRLVFWIVIIIFALTIADVLELTAMRDVIREVLAYLPNVLAAVVVLTVTVAGARLVRDLVAASLSRMQVSFSNSIAAVSFYALIVFGAVMTLDQLGFDTTILTANLTVIVAGVVFALALAFGLGGRDTAKKVVDETYGNYKRSIHQKK